MSISYAHVYWKLPADALKNNIDMTTGDLGLTDHEEDQIVAFLETLTVPLTLRGTVTEALFQRLHFRPAHRTSACAASPVNLVTGLDPFGGVRIWFPADPHLCKLDL